MTIVMNMIIGKLEKRPKGNGMTDKQMTEMTTNASERERSPAKPPSRFRTGKGLAVI